MPVLDEPLCLIGFRKLELATPLSGSLIPVHLFLFFKKFIIIYTLTILINLFS